MPFCLALGRLKRQPLWHLYLGSLDCAGDGRQLPRRCGVASLLAYEALPAAPMPGTAANRTSGR